MLPRHSRRLRRSGAALAIAALATASVTAIVPGIAHSDSFPSDAPGDPAGTLTTTTPIKHLVVIFGENVSFDRYFATYPYAANTGGTPFQPAPGTPTVNGLTGSLLTANPNGANPQRLDPAQALTCDQNHGYAAEQQAFDHGLMDNFVTATGGGASLAQCLAKVGNAAPVTASQDPAANKAVLDYFDGNTVTALWNYAQHFAMDDNSFGTNVGPSTPGALNVTSGNTYGVECGPSWATYWPSGTPVNCSFPAGTTATTLTAASAPAAGAPGVGPATDISDTDPYYDVCSYAVKTEGGDGNSPATTMAMGGTNIGDLLTNAGVTWGWFQGGFEDGYVPGRGTPPSPAQLCAESHTNIGGATVTDYIPHHDPFQYYASTANPQHLPPTSVAAIGRSDQANHQYGMTDFWAAANAGNLPAVSYLKAPAYQDAHAGYSDPLDEQRFVASTINRLERLPTWRSTAVIINYDDSDGWYDHQLGPITSQSQTTLDSLSGTGSCGTSLASVPTTSNGTPEQARCGVGPRIPLMVISPYAKRNFVDHTFTTQSSIIQFIEDNWLGGTRLGNGSADATAGSIDAMFRFTQQPVRTLFVNPSTGAVLRPDQVGEQGRRS